MRKPINISDDCRAHLANSSIVICGLAQNCASKLGENIAFLNLIRKYFERSLVIIVENGSKDATRKILNDYAEIDSQVLILDGELSSQSLKLLDEDSRLSTTRVLVPNPYYSRKRISRMAALRNQYLEKLSYLNQSFDYLMVMDFDVDRISIEGVLNSFAQYDKWDVVTAYGYSTSPFLIERYHDSYALIPLEQVTDEGKLSDNFLTEKFIKSLQRKCRLVVKQGQLIPVYAAFGGLSIFKYNLVKDLRYKVLPNFDNRVEVFCEHVSLCMQLYKNRNPIIAINPLMHLRYQTIFAAVMRKLSCK
jgi:hypothetical protein